MYDIQKASLLKRFSAFLLDFILMTIAVTGLALLFSTIFGYDNYAGKLDDKRQYYQDTYLGSELVQDGVTFEISEEKFEKLDEDTKKLLLDTYAEFQKDTEVIFCFNMLFNLTLTIASLSIVISFLLVEFVMPMIFGNGQTVGKKIFGIGVVHTNAVKVTGIAVFTRAILGKCVIETMIPVMLAITMLFGTGGMTGIIVLGLLLFLELLFFFRGGKQTLIHDVLAVTTTVDLSLQMIFETPEDLAAYKAKLHEESVRSAEY